MIGRLYVLLKSNECGIEDYAGLEPVIVDWHPIISKAIAESWNMPEELVDALELQLETNPPLQEIATYTEVLCAAKLLLHSEGSGQPLVASEYPLLQRLGIADHGESGVTLAEHAEELDSIRQALRA